MSLLVKIAVLFHVAVPTSGQYCAVDGSDYQYTESVSGSTRTVTFNVCPNHWYEDSGALNPGRAVAGSAEYKMPAVPMYESSSTVDLSAKPGGVGVLFDGAYIYSPFAGKVAVTGYSTSATAGEGDTFDKCGLHAASKTDATYHAHTPPVCLLHQLGAAATAHSPQVGWAPDGFPVYGPRGPTGDKLKLCSESTNTDTTNCLDECSGLAMELPNVDQFTYRYYITGEDHFDGSYSSNPLLAPDGTGNPIAPLATAPYYPFTPVCYKGCCPSGATCSIGSGPGALNLPACSGSATAGTTSAYTAAAKYASGLPVYTGVAMTAASPSPSSGSSPSPTPTTPTDSSATTAAPSPPSTSAASRGATAVTLTLFCSIATLLMHHANGM